MMEKRLQARIFLRDADKISEDARSFGIRFRRCALFLGFSVLPSMDLRSSWAGCFGSFSSEVEWVSVNTQKTKIYKTYRKQS